MKLYIGDPGDRDWHVTWIDTAYTWDLTNSKRLDPRPSQKIRNHSPDGFAWGYGGSGPAQLALALLLDTVGQERAERLYQRFKFKVIAALPQDQPWAMSDNVIVRFADICERELSASRAEAEAIARGMGTRADFYAGKGKEAEWLGSIAWDGYRDGIAEPILKATNEVGFRKAVAEFLKDRDDATLPEQGWPWPWDDSGTSDCSYWFFDGSCWDALGYPDEYWARCDQAAPDEDQDRWSEGLERAQFPDMSSRKNVTMGQRSGIILLSSKWRTPSEAR